MKKTYIIIVLFDFYILKPFHNNFIINLIKDIFLIYTIKLSFICF
jgi:hypothetical protein